MRRYLRSRWRDVPRLRLPYDARRGPSRSAVRDSGLRQSEGRLPVLIRTDVQSTSILRVASLARKSGTNIFGSSFGKSPARVDPVIAIATVEGHVSVKAADVQSRPMGDTLPVLRSVLKSQYHASLAMLREAIQRCPPEEWLSTDHKNAFWQLSYHTLFFAHLYLQHDEAAFGLWEKHRGEGDGISGEPYTQAQVLEYWEFCDRMVDDAVEALDLDRTESGFSWYRMSKLEHQLPAPARGLRYHAEPHASPLLHPRCSGPPA